MRKEHLSPAMFHHFKEPIMITDGHMQYLFDEKGKRYLDAFAGIVTVSVGHCHPRVLRAIQDQEKRLQHTTTIYLHPEVALFAQELTARLPPGLDVAYFTNSGTEANDLAILMARAFTRNFDLLALRHAYHGGGGAPYGATAHSTWRHAVPAGFGVRHVACPDAYRGIFSGESESEKSAGDDGKGGGGKGGGGDENALGLKYARELQETIDTCTPGRVAGFLHESIQGVGGAVPLVKGFLKPAYEAVRAAGGICIADEVQTGFGRTGTHYWGFEAHGVVPDIVTMAKGIGNGLPLGAVVTTREVAACLAERLHFNTFGGNPVCAAGGRAVLAAVDEDKCQQTSLTIGDRLVRGLRKIQKSSSNSVVGDVRGSGLMLGIDLVADSRTKEPNPAAAAAVSESLRKKGVLIGKGGLRGNVLRVKPPMCWTEQNADFFLEAFDESLKEL